MNDKCQQALQMAASIIGEKFEEGDNPVGMMQQVIVHTSRLQTLVDKNAGVIDWEAIELAWVLIANAHGGDWELANDEWKAAAERWRDEQLPSLSLIQNKNGG